MTNQLVKDVEKAIEFGSEICVSIRTTNDTAMSVVCIPEYIDVNENKITILCGHNLFDIVFDVIEYDDFFNTYYISDDTSEISISI